MLLEIPTREAPSKSTFQIERLQEVLRKELNEAADESAILHGGWEPVLDSLRMVTVVSMLEDMFDFPLPPEKVVKKGGYQSVDEGVEDMTDNIRRLWDKHHK
jgi:acyl carrier protein